MGQVFDVLVCARRMVITSPPKAHEDCKDELVRKASTLARKSNQVASCQGRMSDLCLLIVTDPPFRESLEVNHADFELSKRACCRVISTICT